MRTTLLMGGKLTYADYLRLPDDGLRYEILDGEVVVSPSAGSPHQGIQAQLVCDLVMRIQRRGLGHVFADLDCHLLRNDVVRPDVLVVLPEHAERILPTHVAGTPDLAIEILSPGTAARDRHRKRHRYAAAGTPELWLVDGPRRLVTQFVHDGRDLVRTAQSGRSLRLAILPRIVVPFARLWQ